VAARRTGLGRGIKALIPTEPTEPVATTEQPKGPASNKSARPKSQESGTPAQANAQAAKTGGVTAHSTPGAGSKPESHKSQHVAVPEIPP
jgi:hypothetical protein